MLLKKSWRNFLPLIIFTISATFPIIVFADETPIPYDYMQDVGEKYVFVMLSPSDQSDWGPDIYDESIRSVYSKSGLYVKGNPPVLVWTLDPDWYMYQADISSNGKYLIEWALLSYRYSDYDSIAFTLFENGQEVRNYAINEFVSYPFLLSSPYEWKENAFIQYLRQLGSRRWLKSGMNHAQTGNLLENLSQ
jgi:hypothetical protein